MDNPPSNFMWDKMQSISTERYQERVPPVLYVPANTTQSFKKGTDWSALKTMIHQRNIQHRWHLLIQREQLALYVKL
ncbi:hypothetical protein [Absidia glauca]|uniref:Uncharacterized protein n=1 Tax=Absidia glauca TaxID=4829 RepID=A0A168T2Q6_ABSGL|nr:hypothetical protein [Absidia glauca]